MDQKDILAVAAQCQELARQVARLQNFRGVSVPQPGNLRHGVLRLKYILFGRPKTELHPVMVAKITSALISGGNMLETIGKEMDRNASATA